MEITISNAIQVAKLLLQLETHHVQEKYQADISAFVTALQKALNQYENPKSQSLEHWLNHSIIEQFEHDLKALIRHTQAFWSLLTLDAQSMMENQLLPHH